MFPIYLYEDGMELPTEGNYYVVAGNGTWLHKDTGIVSGLVPVLNVSSLDDFKADKYVKCNLPKLPAKLVWQIEKFFNRVWQKYKSEANTILYFNKETQDFKVHVPPQETSHMGVNYRREGSAHIPEMAGYLMVGTIHSHADFGAFHSGVDHNDEENFDGLHVTFGDNDKEGFSVSASIVVNGQRTLVDPLSVLEGIDVERVIGLCGQEWPGYYKLSPTTEDWSDVLDQWMSQVNQPDSRPVIKKGDKVEWVGSLRTVSFREHCGVGPFLVEESLGDNLLIKTKVGSAQFRRELFKVVS